MPILLMMVDGHESTPLGVFPNWRRALEAAHDNAFDPDHSAGPLPQELEQAFNEAFSEVFEAYERATSEEGMDLQWEAGTGSWDYRMVHVEVFE